MSHLKSVAPEPSSLGIDLRQAKSLSSFRKGAKFVWLRRIVLLAADTLAMVAAWIIASAASTPYGSLEELVRENIEGVIPVLGLGYTILLAARYYQSGDQRRNYVGMVKAFTLLSAIAYFLFAYFQVSPPLLLERHFFAFWPTSVALASLVRFVIDFLVAKVRQRGVGIYPAALIAAPEKMNRALKVVTEAGHYRIAEVMEADALDRDNRANTLDKLSRLGAIEVFVDWDAIKRRLFVCGLFQAQGLTLRILPSEELPPPSTLKYSNIGGKLCLSCTPLVFSGLEFWTKRSFDVVMASLALLVASPIYLLISLLIYLDSPGPIFYKQTRIGLKNKPFQAWKFRTMVPNADKLQKELEVKNETKDGVLFKIKDDPRITRVGKFLRQYSLDELPQLINVLLGEMSLVGPRPLPLRDVEKFAQHHHIRQEVLPGITGLWQISGRSDIVDFEQAYRLDLAYITNWSIYLDLQILLKTVGVVLRKSGAY